MVEIIRSRARLFAVACLQLSLVAISTYCIAHRAYFSATIVSFGISYCWTFNVRSVAFGTHADRVIYALGAAVGTIAGLGLATLFYEYL